MFNGFFKKLKLTFWKKKINNHNFNFNPKILTK